MESKKLKQKQAHDTSKSLRTFTDGQTVYVEDFTAAKQKWIPGIIRKITGSLSYIINLLNGITVKRHVDSIKARHCTNQPRADMTPEDDTFQLIPIASPLTDEPTTTNEVPPETTSSETLVSSRPVRSRRPPARLNDFVSTEKVSEL